MRLLGPTEVMPSTPGASSGSDLHELSIWRVRSVSGGKSGLVASTTGLPRSVLPLPSAETSVTPWARAYARARSVARITVCCSSCSSGESAGLSAQL